MDRQILLVVFCIFFQVCYTDALVALSSFSHKRHVPRVACQKKIARGVSFARVCFNGQDEQHSFSQGKSAIIVFHGLGDVPHHGYRQYFSQVPDVDVFVPQMPYSGAYLSNKLGVVSMGGTTDLAAALTILKQINDAGYEKIGLYGFSCGGAIVMNVLHALEEPEKFKEFFQELGINSAELKEKIKGCIVDRPFCSYKCSVEANAGRFKGYLAGLYGYRDAVRHVFNHSFHGNEVDLDGVEPLEAAASIKNVPLCIHAALSDKIVGFKGAEEMQKVLQQNNPLVTFIQSPGGHVDPISQNHKNIWTDFFKKYLK